MGMITYIVSLDCFIFLSACGCSHAFFFSLYKKKNPQSKRVVID